MTIAMGSDHGGFALKCALKKTLEARGIRVEDVGCFDLKAADYPDYAYEVAARVADGRADDGILVCTMGIGMSIAANKYPGIRAALCLTPEMAEKARSHNNANVLVLGGKTVPEPQAAAILETWLATTYTPVERHDRRILKVGRYALRAGETAALRDEDPEIRDAIDREIEHEQTTINLIASENYASRAVREAQGSVMTNKYAEGYPGKRWYNGCENVDTAERLAIDRMKRLFGAEHANVQPHCGSSANMAVYFSVLQPGDTILAMSLAHGGHLTHGNAVNFSGRLFRIVGYGVRRDTEQIDYDEVASLAAQHRPKLILAGASSYPRVPDFRKFREIADGVGALMMVDMAHFAGLVAGGCHPSPVPESDFVTTTTHKTLRGPRGGAVLCRGRFAADLDRQVFPGTQGGPLMHVVAAKAVCFHEAMRPEFREYSQQIVRNAKAMAEVLQAAGIRLISGGTDNHLLVVDLTPMGITGRDAANALDRAGVIVNKNAIPFDPRPPIQASGIRIGTPAATTRGMKEPEMRRLAALIDRVLRNPTSEAIQEQTRREVRELALSFPVY